MRLANVLGRIGPLVRIDNPEAISRFRASMLAKEPASYLRHKKSQSRSPLRSLSAASLLNEEALRFLQAGVRLNHAGVNCLRTDAAPAGNRRRRHAAVPAVHGEHTESRLVVAPIPPTF